MSGNPSEYYPPRANWLSPFRARRARAGAFFHSALSPIQFPLGIRLPEFALAIFIPGYSIRRYGFKIIGSFITTVYFFCAAIFLIWLGYSWANLCFSIMLSLHVSSICFLVHRAISDWTFRMRIVSALGILIAVSFLIYLPLRHQIEKFAQPLRAQNRVIVVNPAASPKKLTRGSWVAYTVDETQTYFQNSQAHGTVILRAGFSLGKITALPGDTIRFSKTNFLVNGVSFPRNPQMPADGEIVVPENHWFIWPDLAMNMQGAAAGIYAAELLKNRSMVAQSNFVGVPFKHWCFRSQTL